MTSMQDKVTAALEALTTDANLDFVNQRQFANTGHFYFQSGFDTLLVINYNFQSTNCSLDLSGPAIDEAGLKDDSTFYRVYEKGPNRSKNAATFHSLDYINGRRFEVFFDLVHRLLKKGATI